MTDQIESLGCHLHGVLSTGNRSIDVSDACRDTHGRRGKLHPGAGTAWLPG